MLKNMTIKSRLVFLVGLLVVLLVATGGFGLYGLYANNQALDRAEYRLGRLAQVERVAALVTSNQIKVAESVVGQLIPFPEPFEKSEKRVDEVKASIASIEGLWKTYLADVGQGRERELAKRFDDKRRVYGGEGVLPAITAIQGQDFQMAGEFFQGAMSTHYLPMRESLTEIMKFQQAQAAEEHAAAVRAYAMVRNATFAAVALGALLALVVGSLLIRAITRPLNDAVRIASSVASGNLTQRIEVVSKDETGQLMQAMKDMNENLAGIVAQVRSGTDAIAVASREIAAGNADLSQRTESQASSLEETASSMEELTSTVRQNADNARQANQLVQATAGVAAKGGAVVGQVVDTMTSIQNSSKKIADIIGVIDGIAFQTNILALNAAVEAARAGEQGRGFAVVAAEVRSLAQRSAGAAKEIKTLIEDSVGQVEMGGKLVGEAGKTMNEIVASIKHVTDIVSEIAAASTEQSTGIEQVNQAVEQMDQMTQQNAALVEEAAAAAESMRDQAGKLAEAVGVFKIDAADRGMRTGLPVLDKLVQAPARAKLQSTPRPMPQPKPAQTKSQPRLAAVPRPKKVAAGGGSDEWEEF